MKFVRAVIVKATDEVVCVMEHDLPFTSEHHPDSGHIRDVPCETIDFGAVLEGSAGWSDPVTGKKACASAHIYHRLRAANTKGAHLKGKAIKPAHIAVQSIHDCPCSMDGIKDHMRANGVTAIPSAVRAWLTLMLPPEEVDAIGVSANIPISALLSLEAVRARRDPSAGSRIVNLERKAQQQSDVRNAASMRQLPKEG